MGRPTSPTDCISRFPESNVRMRAAWGLNPKSQQEVVILRAGKDKSEKWLFSWFTLCGARLYCREEGRHHSTLINWDKGDQLFLNNKEANIQIVYNAICEKARLDTRSEELQKLIEEKLEEIKNEN